MIKINLLPKEITAKNQARKRNMLIIAGIACVILIFAGIFVMKIAKAARIKAQIAGVEKELKKLEPIVKRVDEIEAKKAQVDQKIGVIKNLMQSRLYYPIFMEDLAGIMTPKVWLADLKTRVEDTGVMVSVNAYARDNYGVAEFVNSLEQDKKFVEVRIFGDTFDSKKLTGVETVTLEGEEVRKFGLGCIYYPSGEIPKIEKKPQAKKKSTGKKRRR
ncbi:MAG: hypothetical protein JXJ19_03295 [Elusimicrobia bacterium]|nr:hypothetical protein [Elusimicrobiota bacterium]